jgi:hypothetical protein
VLISQISCIFNCVRINKIMRAVCMCVCVCVCVCVYFYFQRQACNANMAESLFKKSRVNAGICRITSNFEGDIKQSENNLILVLM